MRRVGTYDSGRTSPMEQKVRDDARQGRGVLGRGAGGLVDTLATCLFPPVCPGCNGLVEGSGFCASCMPWVELIEPAQRCAICSRPLYGRDTSDGVCRVCRRLPPPYESLQSAAVYAGPVRNAILALKHSGRRGYARELAKLMLDTMSGRIPGCVDYLIAVPLHPGHLRRRGYNQSELLVRHLSRWLSISSGSEFLLRGGPPSSQRGGDILARYENVAGQFRAVKPHKLEGRTVILVDDVTASGATAYECSLVLRNAGCSAVVVWTVARSE